MSRNQIRKLDEQIVTACRRLEGVLKRETWALPVGEQARLAGHVSIVIGKGIRGQRTSPHAESRIELIWANAVDRLRAEIAEAQTAKAELLHQEAKAKVEAARKVGGWW